MSYFLSIDNFAILGRTEEGAYHMANAIIISDHPNELLNIFQQTIPPQHFTLVVQALPSAKAVRFF